MSRLIVDVSALLRYDTYNYVILYTRDMTETGENNSAAKAIFFYEC